MSARSPWILMVLLLTWAVTPTGTRADELQSLLELRLAEQDATIRELQARLSKYETLEESINRFTGHEVFAAADEQSLISPDMNRCEYEGDCSESPCADCSGGCGWQDNLSFFLGLEGSKQPQDFGVNAHFGGRFDVNSGFALSEMRGLGLQIGTSINATANAVQVLEAVGSKEGRVQNFTTAALFQRTDVGLVWGVGYDFLREDYLDDFNLGQWRGKAGWLVGCSNEIGVQFALSDRRDNGIVNTVVGGIPVTVDPITMGSVYWRHTWASAAETTIWAGIAEGHSESNLALPLVGIPEFPPKDEPFLFGAEIHVPLNDSMALFGQGNFISPADTGTVDSYLGFVFYPGGGAFQARQRTYAPVLPVANNTSFAVNLARR
jgi:hypothetical protein